MDRVSLKMQEQFGLERTVNSSLFLTNTKGKGKRIHQINRRVLCPTRQQRLGSKWPERVLDGKKEGTNIDKTSLSRQTNS